MSKIKNVQEATDKTLNLIAQEEYQTLDEINNISRIHVAQCAILDLYRIGYDRFKIKDGVGVNEKTIRMWLNADQAPTLKHLIELAKFYKKAKT
jgi:hypothetical protein